MAQVTLYVKDEKLIKLAKLRAEVKEISLSEIFDKAIRAELGIDKKIDMQKEIDDMEFELTKKKLSDLEGRMNKRREYRK